MAQGITLSELAKHNSPNDAWILIHGQIYDITNFLTDHPGGEEILLENIGMDASLQFDSIGHSESAHELLNDFLIGPLTTETSKPDSLQGKNNSTKADNVNEQDDKRLSRLLGIGTIVFMGILSIASYYLFNHDKI